MSNRLAWIDDELTALDALGLRRTLRERRMPQGVEIEIDGRRVINFGSNDYLGLAADPRLADAVREAIAKHGWGSGASPLIAGRSSLHVALERRIAEFEGAEAALVFSSGFAANVGAIAALAGRGDILFSDAHNHASIIDGCRLSGARVQVYPHRQIDHLERMLEQSQSFRRRLIVTDSLFSMDGDVAPLVELAGLAERYGAMLMVDEAHATGVYGERGRSLCEAVGIEERVDVRVGTLSKALGSMGGFVAGRRSLIDWLANRARSYVFSTAPPAAWCAAGIAALDIAQREPQRRVQLQQRAKELRARLRQQGWNTGESDSQIIPIYIGEPDPTMRLAEALLAEGLFIPGIRPPSVPEGQSLLRVSLSSAHTPTMIDRLCEALRALATDHENRRAQRPG
jgi:8-amino-7-oxononanoate synthase